MNKNIQLMAGEIREYKKDTILTPTFVALEAVCETIIPYVMAGLIDDMTGESLIPVIKYGIILLIVAMISLFSGVMSGRYGARAAAGFGKNLRKDLYYRVQDFAFADIDKFSVSSLITRLTTDVTNVQNAYQMIIRVAVRAPLLMIFSIIMALRVNASMALIFVCILPFLGLILWLISSRAHPIFQRIFKRYDAMNNSVQENVSAIRVVKSFVREDYENKKFTETSEQVRKDFTGAERLLAWNSPSMIFAISLASLLLCWLGARLIVTSGGTSLTTGQLSSLMNYGVQILGAMMMLSMVFVMITMARESANRIAEVLGYESTLTSPDNGLTTIPDGSVEFDHVSFKYSQKAQRYALSDITLSIPSGATVGIIGGTGSSKSTLIQLIPRLYDATEGTVKVGGHNVKDYDLVSLRDSVAVVLQKNVLFSGTIKENMRWGKADATDEEIRKVCQLAQAEEFIQQMPDGYDTYIEQGGTNVSGGQKQRLCIARALLKNPKILILDDSTSAVDTHTDALIRKAFREDIPNTTKIIIAQRIASVEDADVVLVMDKGRIVEQGSPAELMQKGGIYREIYDSQTGSKEAVGA